MGSHDFAAPDRSFDERVQDLSRAVSQARSLTTDKLRGLQALFGHGAYFEIQLAVEDLDERHQDRQHLMAMRIQGLEADMDEKVTEEVQLRHGIDQRDAHLIPLAQDEQRRAVADGKPDPEWLIDVAKLLELHYLDPRPAHHRCHANFSQTLPCIGPRCPKLQAPKDTAEALLVGQTKYVRDDTGVPRADEPQF